MKKIITLGLIFLLGIPAFSYAVGINGATTQGRGKLSVGVDEEYVFNRETRKGKDFSLGPFQIIERLKIRGTNETLLRVSYGLLNGLDVYVRAGMVNPRFYRSFEGTVAARVNLSSKLKGETSLIYGGGLKGALDLPLAFILGCDLQYLRYTADYSGDFNIAFLPVQITTKGKMIYNEWQAAPYVARKFDLNRLGVLTPYVGAKYSHVNLTDKETQSGLENFGFGGGFPARYTSKNVVGAFCGLEYLLNDRLFINTEARFIDETAASVSMGYKF